MYKKTLIILFLIARTSLLAQEGLKIGAEVSPAWDINIQRQTDTGLRSNTNGYGFNIGAPLRWGFSESMSLQTGLTFEIMMFDQRIGKTLYTSTRHGSVNLPIMLNYQVSGGWYFIFGGGFNYNFLNYQWTQSGKIGLTGVTNTFQPYGAAGISTMMEQGNGVFELGVVGRFHFIDLYKPSTFSNGDFTNRILSFDLILRYYLFNR